MSQQTENSKTQDLAPDETSAETAQAETPTQTAGEGQGKRRRVLKKEAKLAIGVSITVVLLALIITLVIIAVQTAGKITQLYAAVYGSVGDEVRNELFIAEINGEYVLTNGDHIVSGRYVRLQFNEGLDGYLYLEESGVQGVLDLSGKEKFRQHNTMPSLFTATQFTPTTATFTENGRLRTYRLSDGAPIAALDGLLPDNGSASAWFTAAGDRFVVLSRTADTLTLTTDKGAEHTLSTDESDSSLRLKRTEGDTGYLLVGAQNDTAVLLQAGSAVRGAFSAATVRVKNKTNVYLSVGSLVLDGGLTVQQGITGGAMQSAGNLLQIGKNVYGATADGLVLVQENARLAERDRLYIVGAQAVYNAEGKQLAALGGNALVLGYDTILESDAAGSFTARNFADTVRLEGVDRVLGMYDDTFLFAMRSGAVRTLSGEKMSAALAAEYGEPQRILPLKNGYFIETARGYFCPADGSYFAGKLIRLGDRTADAFAVVQDGHLKTYRMERVGTAQVATFYYEDVDFLTASVYATTAFRGLAFADGNGKIGLIGANGKLAVLPQYDSLLVCDKFLVVGKSLPSGGQVYAIADFTGKRMTDFTAADRLTPLGDFVYLGFEDGNAQGMVLGAQGKVVLDGILAYSPMDTYRRTEQGWQSSDAVTYAQFVTAEGVRVMRIVQEPDAYLGGM